MSKIIYPNSCTQLKLCEGKSQVLVTYSRKEKFNIWSHSSKSNVMSTSITP